MKKFLLMGLMFISLAACKKDKDPAPDLATRASGTFIATRFIYQGTNIPLTGGTEIAIILQKNTAETVNGSLRLKMQGQSTTEQSLGTLTVKDAGSGMDLLESGIKVGSISSDNQLSVSGEDEDGVYEIIAKKQ
ncbi:MAG: hypothetical protein KF870_00480 [Leadbetterella sp.]|nr:hypothetical protein [Leadbetterella sp.]